MSNLFLSRPVQAQLVLSEICFSNRDSLKDGWGGHPAWVEVLNAGTAEVSLAGWSVGRIATQPLWTYDQGRLDPGGFALLLLSGRSGVDALGYQHAPITPKNLEGQLVLIPPPNSGLSAGPVVSIPALPEDRTWGITQQFTTNRALVSGLTDFRILVPSALTTLDPAWRGGGPFDDSSWITGRGPIGYQTSVPSETNLLNRALGAPVTSSGETWPGLPASALTDGRLDTFTHNLVPVPEFSYWVDLGDTYALDNIEIWNRGDGCCPERLSNYTVSVHPDSNGQPGTAVWTASLRTTGTSSGVGGKDVLTRRLDAAGSFTGRFIQVRSRPDSGDRYFQMAELRAFGAPPTYASLLRTDLGASMAGKVSDAFLRVPLVLNGQTPPRQAVMRCRYDDGLLVYLNGAEVARRQAPPGDPGPGARATAEHFALAPESIVIPGSQFRPGTNIIAVHGLNFSSTNNDFFLDLEVDLETFASGNWGLMAKASPGVANGTVRWDGLVPEPQFSEIRGFKSSPFTLEITPPDPQSILIYTTNGSPPTLTVGIQVPAGTGPARIAVPTTQVVRAACFRDGYESSRIVTHSYLFLNDVLQQPAKPAGFPTTWNGFPADYEMDPDVVKSPAYAPEMLQALRSVPTLSISLATDDLFGPARGIYANSEAVGDAWERGVSLELILPDGSTGFAENAGLRLWGTGWRPHSSSPKHSMQVKFQDQYGIKKLRYPWFPDARVAEFDNVVLRAQGSRSWSDFRTPDIDQAQYIHDSWARDSRRAMGDVEGSATYVHLYLNGLYWGLYNPVEKTDEGFAETRYGGDKSEYDVITRRFEAEADAGDLNAWRRMFQIARSGLASPDRYAELLQYLDVDDFIDYMMLNQYGTNHDGPTSNGNNMRAIRRRSVDGRFRFHVWDMEYTFWQPQENNLNANVADSPAELFQLLRLNAEFRLRFADRARLHLMDGGALTPGPAAQRWQARADELFRAILGESARWGDVRRAAPYTRNVEWYAELQRLLQEYFPVRTSILLQQYREAGLYPSLPAPRPTVPFGDATPGQPIAFEPVPSEIFYTLDGTDPRLPGGGVAPGALRWEPSPSWVTTQNVVRATLVSPDQIPQGWTQPDFADQGWASGRQPVGIDSRSVPIVQLVPLQNATADFSESGRSVAQAIDGNPLQTGWGLYEPDFQGKSHGGVAVFETAQDVGFPEGTKLNFLLKFGAGNRQNMGRYRLSFTTDPRNVFADGKVTRGDVVAHWEILQPVRADSAGGATLRILEDGSIQASGKNPASDTNTIQCVTPRSGITGIRIEALEDLTLPNRGPGRSDSGGMVLTDLSLSSSSVRWNSFLDPQWSSQWAPGWPSPGEKRQVLLRIPFETTENLDGVSLRLKARTSHGWVAWLNGREVARRNITGDPSTPNPIRTDPPLSPASVLEPGATVDLPPGSFQLLPGRNVLAIMLPSDAISDSAFFELFELTGVRGPAFTLTDNITLKARARAGSEWSALQTGSYQVRSTLALTEIMYHAQDSSLVAGDEFDFIELHHSGDTALDLSGYSFTEGIQFVFPRNSILGPGKYAVLVRNAERFAQRYPNVPIQGVYSGRLDNGGERITLVRPDGRLVFSMQYGDGVEWPATADGWGFSLVPDVSGAASLSSPHHWRASSQSGGSPGAADPEPTIPRIRINEIRTASAGIQTDAVELFNPEPQAASLSGWYLTDDRTQPFKYRIPAPWVLPASGYGVLDGAEFGGVAAGTNAFGFKAKGGEEVFLFSADASGRLTGYSHGFKLDASPVGATWGRQQVAGGGEVLVLQSSSTLGSVNGPPLRSPVRISEIHYHPGPGEVEFVELENMESIPVPLYDQGQPAQPWRIRGLNFALPQGVVLPPGGHGLIVAIDPDQFRARYAIPSGVPIWGPFVGSLQNSGEEIVLERRESDYGVAVDRVRFADEEPWPVLADGFGPSLQRVSTDPQGQGVDPASWYAASPSPGRAATGPGSILVSRAPLSIESAVGQSARLSVEAAGSGSLRYQWRHEGTNVPAATNAVLAWTGVQISDRGRWSVAVHSEYGAVLSDEAILSVLTPPTILIFPQPAVANAGSIATFTVVAVDDGTLRYQWRFNDQDIPGATQSSLTINPVSAAVAGRYSVLVESSTGFLVTPPVSLNVFQAPAIVFQPQSISVAAGQPAALFVRVQGTPPFTYKWRRNGVTLFEETSASLQSALTFKQAFSAQGGNYAVTITGSQPPTVTSQTASLTVLTDSDGDGAPDSWETTHGFGVGNASDGAQDPDKDGVSNRDEFTAGTDPRDSTSVLRLQVAATLEDAPGKVELSWQAVAGRSYTLQAWDVGGNDLEMVGNWFKLLDVPNRTTNRVERFVDPATGQGRLYRIVVPAQP